MEILEAKIVEQHTTLTIKPFVDEYVDTTPSTPSKAQTDKALQLEPFKDRLT